jgi:hypothetical protein
MCVGRWIVCTLAALSVVSAQEKPVPSIVAKTAAMRKMDGLFPLYWDERSGKLWMEIPQLDQEFLYLESLAGGVGSNDIGLDRGQPGRARVVKFERIGPKILLIEPNQRYRAITEDSDQRRAVEESFAQSVLWGFEVAAEDNGRVLVDATPLFLHDAHHVSATLRETKQGSYNLDEKRSAIFLERTRNFPRNTEVEAMLTFALANGEAGKYVREVSPSAGAVTVRQHQSFVALPEPGYTPRVFDPRAGYFGISFRDFAAPLDAPQEKMYIARHRLKKRNPSAARSEPVAPIVYYVDRGAPEPLRSALLEGARWWNQAFEAAGYSNAFRVELLPEGVDPMDVRYNVIEWVHRATRGWSYGSSITDPRTGEIIKGHVTLGSLRARQDFLIAEGLLAPYAAAKPSEAMEQFVLARLRQLAAHETGHTLGLMHNFAASVNNRASVMDYPPPVAVLNGPGAPDLSHAYASGIGEWDRAAIAYGYQDFPPGTDEKQALNAIVMKAIHAGLLYLTDADARPAGSASPVAHLWDNGSDPVKELDRMIAVRQRVLERFGENNIPVGAPMAKLEDVLVPAYLMHRYETVAVSKLVGGVSYSYAMRGDGQVISRPVPAEQQKLALSELLKTLAPDFLLLPRPLILSIPPRPPGYPLTREDFPRHTGVTFDPLGVAEAAAVITIGQILNPERASRLQEQHASDPSIDGLDGVIRALLRATVYAERGPGARRAEIQRVVSHVVLIQLMELERSPETSEGARAVAHYYLKSLKSWLDNLKQKDLAHDTYASDLIGRFLTRPEAFTIPALHEPPPGQPIGEQDYGFGW